MRRPVTQSLNTGHGGYGSHVGNGGHAGHRGPAGHTICTDNIFLELSLYSLYMAIRVVIGPS